MFGFSFIKNKEIQNIKETLSIYQRTLEDVGWINLEQTFSDKSYINLNYKQIIKQSKLFWYNNPLAGLIVNVTTNFVFGEGISAPMSKDEKIQEVIDDFWKDKDNQRCLTGFKAQQFISNKIQYEGNLFFILFVDAEANVKVRILNTEEISEVINEDDDRLKPKYYKVRSVSKKYNFDLDAYQLAEPGFEYFMDKDFFDVISEAESDKIRKDAVLYHVKINCDINDKFGIPELFRATPWMRAHKEMAQDVATLIKSLSRFAWKKKVKGGATVVNAIKAAMTTNTNLSNLGVGAGQTQIENQGLDMTAISTPTGGVKIGSDGLRQMLLMVCASSGIMEHYFGDPSTGNLATAKSMELPMVKKFLARQKLFEDVYNTIIQFAIDRKISVGLLSGTTVTDETSGEISYESDVDRTIDINFPPIVEEDLKAMGEALKIGVDSSFISNKTAANVFLTTANQNNVDSELEELFDEDGNPKKEEKEDDPQINAFPDQAAIQKINPGDKIQKVKEAIEVPDKGIPERFAKKNAYLDQRMNGYRRSLAADFNRLTKDINRNVRTSTADNGEVVGMIDDLEMLVNKFTLNMDKSAEKYFPVAADIGRKYAISELKKVGSPADLGEADTDFVVNTALLDNRGFLENSLNPSINDKVGKTMKVSYVSEAAFKEKVATTVKTFESRVEQYVGAFWTLEEAAVKDVIKDQPVMVIFGGADDGGTCEGCANAMAGNPYKAGDAPLPGTFECGGRCRHALQVIGLDDNSY